MYMRWNYLSFKHNTCLFYFLFCVWYCCLFCLSWMNQPWHFFYRFTHSELIFSFVCRSITSMWRCCMSSWVIVSLNNFTVSLTWLCDSCDSCDRWQQKEIIQPKQIFYKQELCKNVHINLLNLIRNWTFTMYQDILWHSSRQQFNLRFICSVYI